MKVGIITFHRALNYGAILQAYALQKYMISMGIETDIIDYRSPYIEEFYKPIKANILRSPEMFIRELAYSPRNVKKRIKFEKFMYKYMIMSKTVHTKEELENLNKEYDFFLAGSDQVWNYKWSGFDKTFFLDFTEDQKKFSYAASFGFENVPESKINEYYKLLSSFQQISVRENSGKSIINRLLDKECMVSIDPTCLIDKDIWGKIAKRPQERGYVLLYTLDASEELVKFAETKAKERNTKVIYISDAIKKKYNFIYKGALSPEEFLGLFINADYIVTNSFHGLMFSVIFEKNFCLQYQKNAEAPNSRLIDFIEQYRLQNRILVGKDITPNNVDYSFVKEKMDQKRCEAHDYLKNIVDQMGKKKNILLDEKEKCCGCRACEHVCPVGAIHMEYDQEGFLYPEIDEKRCIDCSLCVKTCAFKKSKPIKQPSNPIKTLVAYQKDEKKRMHSRSGGVFVSISDKTLSEKGSVYGVDFDSNLFVCHKRAVNKTDRDRFCGSKYVQSDTNDVFSKVYQDLIKGQQVLFSGTPCQIAGLNGYLKNKKPLASIEKLVTIDIVCHGVMAPQIWKDNLKELELNNNSSIVQANFRDKTLGWESHVESYVLKNGQKIYSRRYTAVFYEHCALRPSCYVCPYTSIERESDITLADAWGIKRQAPEWDSSKGVSLVLLNTQKGAKQFEAVSESLIVKSVEIKDMMQPNLEFPTEEPIYRKEFWEEYDKIGYSCIADRCVKKQMKREKKNKLKATLVKFIKIFKKK